jgi:hypothetical protein
VAHRTIFIDLTDWQSIVHGRSQLAASAHAIDEPDFQVSNPITQANASFKMRQSADPRDRIISELQERVRALEMRSAEDDDDGLYEPPKVINLMEALKRSLEKEDKEPTIPRQPLIIPSSGGRKIKDPAKLQRGEERNRDESDEP